MEGLTYKTAVLEDYDDFYKIKCDPENVKWSGFATAPDYNKMKIWYEKQLDSKTRTIYLCYLNGNICGFFYLDKISDDEIEAAASGVLSEYTGRGIGTWTVEKRIEIAKHEGYSTISSLIADDNPKSWRRFEKLGFEKVDIQEDRVLSGGGYKNLSQMEPAAQEIAYGVLSAYTGHGIGTAIVSEAAKKCNAPFMIAKVSEKNRASERCFEKNGFEKFEISERRHLAALGEDHNFNLWVVFVRHKA